MLGDMSKKVKSSLYRKQIDEMLGDGVVARDISAWLKEQNPPESISKSLIYEYKGDHFDVEKEAVQQYSDLKSKYVYTPIIEGVANEILAQHDITGGRLTVEYNPFLSKNIVETASILKDLWPIGCITENEVRSKLDLPPLTENKVEQDEKDNEDRVWA
jgi:hypothetical protein